MLRAFSLFTLSLAKDFLRSSPHRDIAQLVQRYIPFQNYKKMNISPVQVSQGTLESLEISRSVDAPAPVLRPHVEEILRSDRALSKKLDGDEISVLAEVLCTKENVHKRVALIFAEFFASRRAGRA
jgi:hypothetical protein